MSKKKTKVEPGENSLLVSQNTGAAVPITVSVRPLVKSRKYDSPEKMLPVIESYFNSCDSNNKKYSVEGLALSLGFTSTESLRVYGTHEGYEAFHELVTSAKLKIQQQRVEDLQAGELNPIAGIFLLSNCHRDDYKRDPDSKEAGAAKIESFMFEYEKPKQINGEETTKNEIEADSQAG